MSKRASPTLIGSFVVGAVALGVTALAVLGSGRLFHKTEKFVLYFDSDVSGLTVPPIDFSFILGVTGGLKATARHLAFQAENAPPGSTWKVIAVSREQWTLVSAALGLGGDIRVGLEDNFYLPDGAMARSNGELVERAARMVRDQGREVASAEECRRRLDLRNC